MLVVEGGDKAETPHLLLELAVLVVGLLDQVELIQHQMQLTLLEVVEEGQVLFNMQQLPATLREVTVVPE